MLRTSFILAAAVLVILAGQTDRDLLTVDDYREAEVAREMLENRDFIVPRLAGTPFVEKPSGFPVIVAAAYRLVGRPSIPAARFVAASFALASLAAVFLLGWRVMGLEGGALAAAFLAFSSRFCRTAHEILLDNALTAALAFALLFAWIALEGETPRARRRASTSMAFALGLAFLFKGFVGPALFGAGLLFYLLTSRRLRELGRFFGWFPAAAFLVPVLAWTIPFILRAPSDLLYQFFIANHFGRFLAASQGHDRSFYFYLLNLWPSLLPVSMLLPFAVLSAWRKRREPDGRPAIFFLAMAVGMLGLLSLSRVKDSVYLLPAYPSLALLAAWWCEGLLARAKTSAFSAGFASLGLIAVLWAITMAAFTLYLGGSVIPMAILLVCVALAAWRLFVASGRMNPRSIVAVISGFLAFGWILWFTGPVMALEAKRLCLRQPVEEIIRQVEDGEILLYHPNDAVRGAFGFYGLRTALNCPTPLSLIEALRQKPDAAVVVRCDRDFPERRALRGRLVEACEDRGIRLIEKACIQASGGVVLALYSPAFNAPIPGVRAADQSPVLINSEEMTNHRPSDPVD